MANYLNGRTLWLLVRAVDKKSKWKQVLINIVSALLLEGFRSFKCQMTSTFYAEYDAMIRNNIFSRYDVDIIV